jgi:hypothetical protein
LVRWCWSFVHSLTQNTLQEIGRTRITYLRDFCVEWVGYPRFRIGLSDSFWFHGMRQMWAFATLRRLCERRQHSSGRLNLINQGQWRFKAIMSWTIGFPGLKGQLLPQFSEVSERTSLLPLMRYHSKAQLPPDRLSPPSLIPNLRVNCGQMLRFRTHSPVLMTSAWFVSPVFSCIATNRRHKGRQVMLATLLAEISDMETRCFGLNYGLQLVRKSEFISLSQETRWVRHLCKALRSRSVWPVEYHVVETIKEPDFRSRY